MQISKSFIHISDKKNFIGCRYLAALPIAERHTTIAMMQKAKDEAGERPRSVQQKNQQRTI